MPDPMDELEKMMKEAVEVDRDDILERERRLPDEAKAEITRVMKSVRETLDPDSNDDNRPIVERLIAARCHLGSLIAHLSGASFSEMMEHELEMVRLAEAMTAAVALDEALRKITGLDDEGLTNGN